MTGEKVIGHITLEIYLPHCCGTDFIERMRILGMFVALILLAGCATSDYVAYVGQQQKLAYCTRCLC